MNSQSNRDEVILVIDEFGQTEELGVRQCGLPTSEERVDPK